MREAAAPGARPVELDALADELIADAGAAAELSRLPPVLGAAAVPGGDCA